MAPCGSQDLTDKRRKEILLCCDTIQGCSDILAVGIGGLSQHCKPATPDADVHSSLIGALTHLQSYHGPSDSLILPHAGGKSVPSLEGIPPCTDSNRASSSESEADPVRSPSPKPLTGAPHTSTRPPGVPRLNAAALTAATAAARLGSANTSRTGSPISRADHWTPRSQPLCGPHSAKQETMPQSSPIRHPRMRHPNPQLSSRLPHISGSPESRSPSPNAIHCTGPCSPSTPSSISPTQRLRTPVHRGSMSPSRPPPTFTSPCQQTPRAYTPSPLSARAHHRVITPPPMHTPSPAPGTTPVPEDSESDCSNDSDDDLSSESSLSLPSEVNRQYNIQQSLSPPQCFRSSASPVPRLPCFPLGPQPSEPSLLAGPLPSQTPRTPDSVRCGPPVAAAVPVGNPAASFALFPEPSQTPRTPDSAAPRHHRSRGPQRVTPDTAPSPTPPEPTPAQATCRLGNTPTAVTPPSEPVSAANSPEMATSTPVVGPSPAAASFIIEPEPSQTPRRPSEPPIPSDVSFAIEPQSAHLAEGCNGTMPQMQHIPAILGPPGDRVVRRPTGEPSTSASSGSSGGASHYEDVTRSTTSSSVISAVLHAENSTHASTTSTPSPAAISNSGAIHTTPHALHHHVTPGLRLDVPSGDSNARFSSPPTESPGNLAPFLSNPRRISDRYHQQSPLAAPNIIQATPGPVPRHSITQPRSKATHQTVGHPSPPSTRDNSSDLVPPSFAPPGALDRQSAGQLRRPTSCEAVDGLQHPLSSPFCRISSPLYDSARSMEPIGGTGKISRSPATRL